MRSRGWLAVALTVAVTLAMVLALKKSGKADAGGFWGQGPLLSDLNLLLEILLVLGLTAGMVLARRGDIEAHRRNQTAWVLVNLVFVTLLMVPSITSFKFNGLADFRDAGNVATWLHAAFGAMTVVSGLWLVLQMNGLLPRALRVRRWKALMRATLAGYWTVALLGIATYRAWYAA